MQQINIRGNIDKKNQAKCVLFKNGTIAVDINAWGNETNVNMFQLNQLSAIFDLKWNSDCLGSIHIRILFLADIHFTYQKLCNVWNQCRKRICWDSWWRRDLCERWLKNSTALLCDLLNHLGENWSIYWQQFKRHKGKNCDNYAS